MQPWARVVHTYCSA